MEIKIDKRVLIIGSNIKSLIQAFWYATNGYFVTYYNEICAKSKLDKEIFLNQNEKLKQLYEKYGHKISFASSKGIFYKQKIAIILSEDTIVNGAYKIDKILDDIDMINRHYNKESLLIITSELPYGLTSKIEQYLKETTNGKIKVIYSPFFETDNENILNFKTLFVGVSNEEDHQLVSNLYFPHIMNGTNIFYSNFSSLELAMYLHSIKERIHQLVNQEIQKMLPEDNTYINYLMNILKNEDIELSILETQNNDVYGILNNIKKTIKQNA